MGFLQRIVGPPMLTPADFSDVQKVYRFVTWCVSNDSLAKEALNPTAGYIFSQGVRPMTGAQTDPLSLGLPIDDMHEWVVLQIYMVLGIVKPASQEEWCMFLSRLNDEVKAAGAKFVEWGRRVDVDLEHAPVFDLNAVAERLDMVRALLFWQDYLRATVLAGEARIYALWYRHRYGQWPRYYTEGEILDWCERKGRLPSFVAALESKKTDSVSRAKDRPLNG
jgi:hypothetical protein